MTALRLRLARAAGVAVLALAGSGTDTAAALDNGLARTPPMGWNSWYTARCDVTEAVVLRNARALVDSGLAARGYRYVNVDGCWEAPRRDAHGDLRGDPARFPSGMAELGRRIHALGLRYGVYTSAGTRICNHAQPGSWDHFRRDMRRFAAWRVDYVKVDWCDVPRARGGRRQDPRRVYARAARAAARAGRRMIVTVSTPGVRRPWRWAARYGNTWRIGADADGTWAGVMRGLDLDAPLFRHAGPGGWNDPDILQVGDGVLSQEEERAHLSLWSVLAAPLLAGYDLASMAPEDLALLANRRVIAVDQDRRGLQGRRVRRRGGVETWVRRLSGRAAAVLVLNRTSRARAVGVRPAALRGVPDARRYATRELWTGESRRIAAGERLRATVGSHGVAIWRVRATK